MKAMKLLSIALVAMLALSLLPPGYAQPPPVKKAEERYKAAKSSYLSAMEMYKNARQDFMKIRGPAKRGTVPFDKLQNFVLRSIDAMIAHIELVKARVEMSGALTDEEKSEAIERLDTYVSYLKEKRIEAEQAENREQLLKVGREVRTKWLEVRLEVRKIAGRVIISRIDRILTRAEEIGDRLEVRVEALREAGEDTTELEALLQQYREHLSLAAEKRNMAEEKLNAVTSPEDAGSLREAHTYLRETNRHIKEMFVALRQIARELRDKEVTVTGFGALFARGNGSAVLRGDGGVFVSGNGTLTVKVSSGRVRVVGAGEKQENEDGSVTYRGFGRAKVVGRGIHVSVTGENLLIRAVGRGTAELSGTGEWRTVRVAGSSWSGEVSYGGEVNESS